MKSAWRCLGTRACADSPALGAVLAAGAFAIWGVSPLYWKSLSALSALEIVMHRVVWSFLFLLPVLTVFQGWEEFRSIFRSFKALGTLVFTTCLIGCNWFIFIWAVNHGEVLQTSLGYYMNPLINVVLGVVFLRERLRRLQVVAVLLAAAAVAYLTLDYGRFPWIALSLSFAFGFYGLIRKKVAVSALTGLVVELCLLSGFAVVYLGGLYRDGRGVFLRNGPAMDLLIMAAALFTAVPLLLFNLGARRIRLATLGFLQYITPSSFFLLAVFRFHEPITAAQVWTFGLIWVALACYSVDSLIATRHP
ncbi:chloramphenicol-sensitive protein RarD [Desulfacinum hydrothermale DSM 13146]|uniref:Chloramphenicol-sensitive protein RarD n=1 Tax=Desulfacinum hydrothermale DSM 13146 TaxID=1121390 RepID=A0A1W1XM17_9BACT|nr:EamA family transporter RarD [Desulfacinum hydrothermale]SMC25040.1 chloramphenicol-sensitive protein RarD [Desulfacinum hydrothermale DSM 13146]